jgi:hypothetical protein
VDGGAEAIDVRDGKLQLDLGGLHGESIGECRG